MLVDGQRALGRLQATAAAFAAGRRLRSAGSHEERHGGRRLRQAVTGGGRRRGRAQPAAVGGRLAVGGQHAVHYAALAARAGRSRADGEVSGVRGRRRRRRRRLVVRGRSRRPVIVLLVLLVLLLVMVMVVMVTDVGICRGAVRGRCGRRSHRVRHELVVIVVMVKVWVGVMAAAAASERPERFLHHLLQRLRGLRRRKRRRHGAHIVLRLKLAVLAASANRGTASAAATAAAVKVRRASGRGRGGRRVLVSVGDGRDVGQGAVCVRAGRGRLQYRGRKRGVRVHGVRPRHRDPLPFVLHPSVLEPHLKSTSGNSLLKTIDLDGTHARHKAFESAVRCILCRTSPWAPFLYTMVY